MNVYLELVLSIILAITALALTRVRDLFAIVALLSVYSIIIALIFAILGAVDVAFTEVVVGTGVSTVFLMAVFKGVDPYEMTQSGPRRQALGIALSLAVGGFLLYAVHALPEFGSPDAPATVYLSPEYAARSMHDMATPNVVTAVLGDYRSFDTLIETAVILTAALACILILGRRNGQST